MSTPTTTQPALIVSPPSGGFDRAGVRDIIKESGLSVALHKLVRAPFGHTVLTLRALEAVIEAGDLALQAGEALQAALLEDIARSGSLALPEPTKDQRLFIGAFQVTALADALSARLGELAPSPEVHADLEADGLEDLLRKQPKPLTSALLAMAGKYLEVQAQRQPGAGGARVDEREVWVVTTLHAFIAAAAGGGAPADAHGPAAAVRGGAGPAQGAGRRPALRGFNSRSASEPVSDLKPVQLPDVVGNQEYLQAGLKLARDVAAYDLAGRRSPKKLNPVLFGLGRPGCGKTITAHAIGNYFLEYCRQRDIPARFKVIRRTDWASSYQNASAATLVKIFKEEVYGFDGVCGVYWPDIDTAFASRSSGDLRSEEKNNLGAVFGIFDGTLIPKDGKWFMICDANFMQMDEATRSRIAQNPFTVKGPTTSEDYVHLLRDVLLGELRQFVAVGEEGRWSEVGDALVKADLSGRSVESIAGNIRATIQDFEYPDEYFKASFDERTRIIDRMSKRVPIATVLKEVADYVAFNRDSEEREAKQAFDREVAQMVQQLNAGRAATARAAAQAEKDILGG
jgi:hypothetical protein